VDLAPVRPLATPVTLAQIKESAELANVALLRQSRLSVMPVTAEEHKAILALARG
jgi:predicted RNA-binding protein with PUA-like domain